MLCIGELKLQSVSYNLLWLSPTNPFVGFPVQGMKMRGIIASCTLAALLLAVASAVHHHRHHQHHHHDHLHHDDDVACYKLSPANARFSFALYKSLSAKSAAGKNIFFSPLGISSALTMLSKGARGETHRQLVSTLGYSAFNQSEVDEAYQHLFQMLNPSEGNQQLSFGNAAAVSRSFNPLGSYVSDVSLYYSGKVFDVNFREPANAAAEINRYIAQNTRDMIKDQVKDLDPDTAMVLINYIYFSGRTYRSSVHIDLCITHEHRISQICKSLEDAIIINSFAIL